jgi:hypothetical protein
MIQVEYSSFKLKYCCSLPLAAESPDLPLPRNLFKIQLAYCGFKSKHFVFGIVFI